VDEAISEVAGFATKLAQPLLQLRTKLMLVCKGSGITICHGIASATNWIRGNLGGVVQARSGWRAPRVATTIPPAARIQRSSHTFLR